jgi:hypothetical protein
MRRLAASQPDRKASAFSIEMRDRYCPVNTSSFQDWPDIETSGSWQLCFTVSIKAVQPFQPLQVLRDAVYGI